MKLGKCYEFEPREERCPLSEQWQLDEYKLTGWLQVLCPPSDQPRCDWEVEKTERLGTKYIKCRFRGTLILHVGRAEACIRKAQPAKRLFFHLGTGFMDGIVFVHVGGNLGKQAGS